MNEINDNKKAMSEDVKQALIRFNKDNIYVQNLKIELVDMSLGYVKGKMMVTEDVLNPYGSVHGGCLYSLADIVSGIAACTYGKFSSTIDGTMTYIAPAMNTERKIPVPLHGNHGSFQVVERIRQGKKVSLYEANIYDDKGQLVDKARFSFYMMNRSVVE